VVGRCSSRQPSRPRGRLVPLGPVGPIHDRALRTPLQVGSRPSPVRTLLVRGLVLKELPFQKSTSKHSVSEPKLRRCPRQGVPPTKMPRNPTLDCTNAKLLERCNRQQHKQVSRHRATENDTSFEQTRGAINSAHALPVNHIFPFAY